MIIIKGKKQISAQRIIKMLNHRVIIYSKDNSIPMTVRGNHLQCDGRSYCLSCRGYTWPPNPTIPKKYYHCNHCNADYLCEGGLWITFHYLDDGQMVKKIQCNRCYELVEERVWPKNVKSVIENFD